MLYYLDSSAWVKRYFDEVGSGYVNGLFERHQSFGCSPLGLIEVGATMARKRRAGEVTREEFGPKRASLLKDWGRFLRMDMTSAVVERAVDLTDAHGLRGADSVHLASAMILKEEMELASHDFTLVTSDGEMKIAAQRAGLAVVDPQVQSEDSTHRAS